MVLNKKVYEILANFLDFELVSVGQFNHWSETKWQVDNAEWMKEVKLESGGEYLVNIQKNIWFNFEEVKLTDDWYWLMQVIEKIEMLGFKTTGYYCTDNKINSFCSIILEPNEFYGDIVVAVRTSKKKKEAVLMSLVEFILKYKKVKELSFTDLIE